MSREPDAKMPHAAAGAGGRSTSLSSATSTTASVDVSFVEFMKAAKSQEEVLNYLRTNSSEVNNASDSFGFTPLFWARRRGFAEVERYLTAAAAPISASYLTDGRHRVIRGDGLWCTSEGIGLIVGIIERDELDALDTVLKIGHWPSQLLIQDTEEAMVPASFMAKLGRTRLLTQLLTVHPEEVNSGMHLTAYNTTPLIEAARAAHIETVALLLKYKADPSFKNVKGETAESVTKDERILAYLAEARVLSSFGKS